MGWNSKDDWYRGAQEISTGSNQTLVFGSAVSILITPSAAIDVTLPDATQARSHQLGGPHWCLTNDGAFTITIKDDGGNTLDTLAGNGTKESANIYLADNSTANGTWVIAKHTVASVPAPPVDEKFYWLAGFTSVGADRDKVDIYDIELDSWSTGTDATTNHWKAAGFVISDKGYVARGDANTDRICDEYDAGLDSWANKDDLTEDAAEILSGDDYSGKGYVSGLGAVATTPDGTAEYNAAGDAWTGKQDATKRTDDSTAQTWDSDGSVIFYGSDINLERDTVQKYGISANSWSALTDMVFPGRIQAGSMQDSSSTKAWLYRGSDGTSGLDDVDLHTFSTDSWQEKNDHPAGTNSANGVGMVEGRIFVSSGAGSDTDHYEHIHGADSWQAKEDVPREKNASPDQAMGINAA